MNVLVGYASGHGSTAGIAERIAEDLRGIGLAAEAKVLHDLTDVCVAMTHSCSAGQSGMGGGSRKRRRL